MATRSPIVTAAELKVECLRHGLKRGGKKVDLQQRLRAAPAALLPLPDSAAANDDGGGGDTVALSGDDELAMLTPVEAVPDTVIESMADRLRHLHAELGRLVTEHEPQVFAVETVFHGKSFESVAVASSG